MPVSKSMSLLVIISMNRAMYTYIAANERLASSLRQAGFQHLPGGFLHLTGSFSTLFFRFSTLSAFSTFQEVLVEAIKALGLSRSASPPRSKKGQTGLAALRPCISASENMLFGTFP